LQRFLAPLPRIYAQSGYFCLVHGHWAEAGGILILKDMICLRLFRLENKKY